MESDSVTSFPIQHARTRRFTLGVPRSFSISDDGRRVAFLRTHRGDDAETALWLYDVTSGAERLVVDPRRLDTEAGTLPVEERARRERSREAASGIVRYSADRSVRRAVFDLQGAIWAVDLESAHCRGLPAAGPAVDPRLDPTGRTVAYVRCGALRVIGWDGADDRELLHPERDEVTYGLAEFVAAEEMGRQEGFWWSPDGSAVLVERADVAAVRHIQIADPADPERQPLRVAYPFAGTPNADVSLVLSKLDGTCTAVQWDRRRFEYLAAVRWHDQGLFIVVQTRDQRTVQLLGVDVSGGATSLVREDMDPAWVEIFDGVPQTLRDGTSVWVADEDGSTRLVVGGRAVTPDGLQVRAVLAVDGDTVLFSASDDPVFVDVWSWSPETGARRCCTDTPRGVATAARHGGTTVTSTRSLDAHGVQTTVHSAQRSGRIESRAETPLVTPAVRLLTLGERELRAALLFPSGHAPGRARLPVLLDPYGGPAAQRVLAASSAFLVSQWWADQGFAVLVIDGRGTPGRGPAWKRTIRGDHATPVLQDQVDGLHDAAAMFADLDVSRVAIRGWSYGGFLAALAVLRRPDVFHAAVAGAPVTDERLYDTHYTERYLGHPEQEPRNYERLSLLSEASNLSRPLLLIHGLSDDNVLVANTLRLSAALFATGRPHAVLPLPGVTHSTNRQDVAAAHLLHERAFLTEALGMPGHARMG